jgi:hypothetical protein
MTRIGMQRSLSESPRPMPRLRPTARSAAFAQRLAARYTRGRAARRGVALLLADARFTLVQQVLHRHLRRVLSQSLRASFTLGTDPHAALDLRRADRSPGRGPAPEDARRVRPDITMGAAHRVLAVQVVQRLRRVEIDVKRALTESGNRGAGHIDLDARPAREASLPLALPAAPAFAATARSSDPGFAQQQRGRAPAQTMGAASGERADAAREALDSRRPSVSAPPASRALAVPEQEIERLAERVIGTIDRRIAAQRERLGRP